MGGLDARGLGRGAFVDLSGCGIPALRAAGDEEGPIKTDARCIRTGGMCEVARSAVVVAVGGVKILWCSLGGCWEVETSASAFGYNGGVMGGVYALYTCPRFGDGFLLAGAEVEPLFGEVSLLSGGE